MVDPAVHYDPGKGSAAGWALMIARRRAIDRVRSSVASAVRDQQAAAPAELRDQTHEAAALRPRPKAAGPVAEGA